MLSPTELAMLRFERSGSVARIAAARCFLSAVVKWRRWMFRLAINSGIAFLAQLSRVSYTGVTPATRQASSRFRPSTITPLGNRNIG